MNSASTALFPCSCDEAAIFTEWIGGMLAADDELADEASKDDLFNELLGHVCRFEDGEREEAEAAMQLALERFNSIQNRAFISRRAANEVSHG